MKKNVTTYRGKTVKVKGITMTNPEYEAFVKYLNRIKAESFRKQDVLEFLEAYHTDSSFKRGLK